MFSGVQGFLVVISSLLVDGLVDYTANLNCLAWKPVTETLLIITPHAQSIILRMTIENVHAFWSNTIRRFLFYLPSIR